MTQSEIAHLDLSRRTLSCLVNAANYETVEQVTLASDGDLLAKRDFAFKSLEEIRSAMNQTTTATSAYPNPINDRIWYFCRLGLGLPA